MIIESSDISSSPVLASKFRCNLAKEIYRCGKGIVLTRFLVKLIAFAVLNIPVELFKGVVYSTIGQIGDAAMGYITGIGFIKYIYKIPQLRKLKATVRIVYNIGCFPITIYSKRIGKTFDLFGVSKLEKLWFGQPVYIFNDNRLWVEKNFTISELLKRVSED